MEFFEAVDTRRSIRAFRSDPVPPEVLERCLDAALKAPSSSNLQHWEFVLIREPEARARALRVCLDQKGPATAPLLVAVVAHTDTWRRNSRLVLDTLAARGVLRKGQQRYWGRHVPLIYRTGPFGLLGLLKGAFSRLLSLVHPTPNLMTRSDVRVMAHKSTALAAATFMLALRAEGWDSCPMEGFDPWRARKLLGLAPGAEVCMFLAVGRRGGDQAIWFDRILLPRDWAVRELQGAD